MGDELSLRVAVRIGILGLIWITACDRRPTAQSSSSGPTSSSASTTAVCQPGATTCEDSGTFKFCTAAGNWRRQSCFTSACVNGECVGSCRPGSSECRDQQPMRCNDSGEFVPTERCADFEDCDERDGRCGRPWGTFWPADPASRAPSGDAYDLKGKFFNELCTSMYHHEPMQMAVRTRDRHYAAAYSGMELVVVNHTECCNPPANLTDPSRQGAGPLPDCPWAVVARFSTGQRKALAWSPSGELLAVASHHGPERNPSSVIHVFSVAKRRQIQTVQVPGLYAHRIAFTGLREIVVSDFATESVTKRIQLAQPKP